VGDGKEREEGAAAGALPSQATAAPTHRGRGLAPHHCCSDARRRRDEKVAAAVSRRRGEEAKAGGGGGG